MINYILRILYHKNRLCVCLCIRLFYFKGLFSATAGPILTKVGTKRSIDSGFINPERNKDPVIWSGSHIIKGAVRMCLISILSPISQQPLELTNCTNPGRKVGTVSAFIIPKIRMISHIERILYYKN